MTGRVDPELQDEAVAGRPTDEAGRNLSLRAREGDRPAAYEVLGQQHPTDVWVQVLRALARNPAEVDLEVVAHRALRRPPAVVTAVVELARAARTPIAAFLAGVIAENRSEEGLRAEAALLNAELVALFDVQELLANDDAAGALYALLARPLADQAGIVAELAPDAAATNLLFNAARAEYERLQEVARDTRWRSGSYRHALRHALADLALVAGVGGRLEDQAFRLLQQRTDEPEANAELLDLVSADIRSRYLDWTLDRSAAESSPARALFAIDELARYPDGVGRNTVKRLLTCNDVDVAAAAAVFLLTSDPHDGSNDREIAELLVAADDTTGARIVGTIAESAPDRLRIDLWPSGADPIVAERGAGSAAALERLTATLRESSDVEVQLRAVRLLGDCGAAADDRKTTALTVASIVLARSPRPTEQELEALLGVDWLREGTWRALHQAPDLVRERCLETLLPADPPTVVWRELSALHSRIDDDHRRELEEFVLDAVAEDRLGVDELATTDRSDLLDALRPAAEQRARSAADEVAHLRSLVALGDRAAEVELSELVQPLIVRAIERSTGNQRLIGDYTELGSALQGNTKLGGEDDDTAVDEADLRAIATALKATGVTLLADQGRVSAVVEAKATVPQIIRALAIIDQRVARAPGGRGRDTALATLAATAGEAARVGAAEEILRDLFEHGPLFQAAIALSPAARSAVLDAALAVGFVPGESWRRHDVLGPWLRDAMGESAREAKSVTATDALIALQRIERDRREVEDRLQAGRTAARHAFIASVKTSLEDLEQTADTYVQLWLGLARLGIRQVAALGQRLTVDELESSRHELVGNERAGSYVVRSGGLQIDGDVVRRARVEAID